MSFLITRNVLHAARMSRYILCTRAMGQRFTDPLEHATGIEKAELLAIQSGNDDPFDMRVFKRGPGTKEKPNEIPSLLPKRMVGCICEEDSTHINYMWLHMGEPKRCECGYWFKLVERKPIEY